MKEGFVYKWVHIKTGKIYIGSHFGKLNDGYVSSSKEFNKAYIKEPDMFKRSIVIKGLSREEALQTEKHLLVEVDAANNDHYYNLHNEPGTGWSHHDNFELAKKYYAKISAAKKGQPAWNKGKKLWNETNLHKISDIWNVTYPNGKNETILNMLQFCREHRLNPSAMSAVARGNRRHYKGYKCYKISNKRNVAYEYKEWKSKGKPGKAHFGSNNGWSKRIKINERIYGCMREASNATGLSMYKLKKLGDFNV